MIHPCDKSCVNKTASGYCATTACINPLYSNIGTAQYGQGVQKRITTNADRIRSMSDEELAKKISGIESFALTCGGGWPPEKWLDWMKKEYEGWQGTT